MTDFLPLAVLERALEIKAKFGLEAADAHFFNVALDAVAANPSKWTLLAEGVQKEALRAAVAAGGNLSRVGDLKLAQRIATEYLREASAGVKALPVKSPSEKTDQRTNPPAPKGAKGARETGPVAKPAPPVSPSPRANCPPCNLTHSQGQRHTKP